MPQKISTYISEQETNPWKEEVNKRRDEVRQVDGIIEIDSTSDSDSDAPPQDCISILSSDSDHDAMDAADLAAEFDDDDESISLTDDESSSEPASPVESIDLDDLDLADHDGAHSPSWNSVSTDAHSERMEEQPQSGHNSEDEQGVFLYDTESEEMDDVDPIDVDFDPSSQTVVNQSHFLPPQTIHPPHLVPSGHPILPPIGTAVLSQQAVPEFGCQLAPVMQPAPRQASPSDAILPVSRRHHGSEDDVGITVESLGLKSGKPAFFEAREQNKTKLAQSVAFHAQDANLLAEISSNTAIIDGDAFRPVTGDISQRAAAASMDIDQQYAPALNKESRPEPSSYQGAHYVPVPQPFSGRMKIQGNRELSRSSYDFIPLTLEEALSTAPLEETSGMDIKAQEVVDPGWTAASADELFQMKQLAQIRTNRASKGLLDPPEVPMASESSEPRLDTTKGKRKAAEISETNGQELLWHEHSTSDQQPVPRSPVPVQPETDMDPSSLSFRNTSEQEAATVRPTKMRKIAERVGYAALGGATVGAMVLTSLIYTAPNFA